MQAPGSTPTSACAVLSASILGRTTSLRADSPRLYALTLASTSWPRAHLRAPRPSKMTRLPAPRFQRRCRVESISGMGSGDASEVEGLGESSVRGGAYRLARFCSRTLARMLSTLSWPRTASASLHHGQDPKEEGGRPNLWGELGARSVGWESRDRRRGKAEEHMLA